jgi:phenylacetate-coenzyme A ligase PaaK-like adenylate-forming protein
MHPSMSGQTVDLIGRRIAQDLIVRPEERASRQDGMVRSITSGIERSAVYSGRVSKVSGMEDLSQLPLTSYALMDRSISAEGLDACLLAPAEHVFKTSGSTGSPKCIYYSAEDVDRIALDFGTVCRLVGVRPGDMGWNLGGARPNVSGAMMERTCDLVGIKKLTTLLTHDSDLMGAMRLASKADRIDVMATAALVMYFLSRSMGEPGFLDGVVRQKLRRDYHLPGPLADLATRLYLSRIDIDRLRDTLSRTRIALTYAEPLTPYMHDLRSAFPDLIFHDVLGSTENPVLAAQLDPRVRGLHLFVHAVVPELADPAEVVRGLETGNAVKGVPWYEWKKGMRGELLITRPGGCLPLVRYPTGDMIEVLDPAAEVRVDVDGEAAFLPLIRMLGRSVETLDFEVPDEMGCFLGNKIYAHHIHEALQRPHNVRWWELYNIRGEPGRLCFLVIPDKDVDDAERFKRETLNHLLRECDDPHHTLQIGHELGRVEVLTTTAKAYSIVQQEIDRRVKEGRSLGQLKPKRIYKVDSEEEFRSAVKVKLEA